MNARARFLMALTLFVVWAAWLGYLGAVSSRPAPSVQAPAHPGIVER